MDSIVGKKYRPFDNSYCINRSNGKGAFIVQRNEPFDGGYFPNKEEDGAKFEIISEPYKEEVKSCFDNKKIYTFIDVKSIKTGNIYRVLFFKNRVVEL